MMRKKRKRYRSISNIERKERQQLQWRIFSREMHSGLVETNL